MISGMSDANQTTPSPSGSWLSPGGITNSTKLDKMPIRNDSGPKAIGVQTSPLSSMNDVEGFEKTGLPLTPVCNRASIRSFGSPRNGTGYRDANAARLRTGRLLI